jgi:hypothetical protein
MTLSLHNAIFSENGSRSMNWLPSSKIVPVAALAKNQSGRRADR